jgi:hypothetical protein
VRSLILTSKNANGTDDLGHTWSGNSFLIILVVILLSSILVGYGINERAQGLAQHSVYGEDSVIQYGSNGIQTYNDLLGNFSGMSLVENFTTPEGTTSSFVISYSLLGTTLLNDISTYKVSISGTALSGGEKDPESVLAWISASTGQVLQTYDSDDGYLQGISAEGENATLSLFTTLPFLSMLNSSTVEPVLGSEQSMTLGQVSMEVTTYYGLQSFSTLKDWTVDVGVIPSTGLQFVTYCTYISSSDYQFTFHMTSIDSSPFA